MLHLVRPNRTYNPETIDVMTAAFERVCQSVLSRINGNDEVRRTVALIILRHVDQGERDPMRLSEVAFRELAGIDRSEVIFQNRALSSDFDEFARIMQHLVAVRENGTE
jgi:hypothetical protein